MFGGGMSSYCLALERKDAVITLPSGYITFRRLKAPSIKNSYFAYQLGGGVKLDAGDKISFDIGYRMINIKSPEFTVEQYSSENTHTTYYDVNLQNKYSHSLMFGLAYSF
jgi:opacity protein-like surface antigen